MLVNNDRNSIEKVNAVKKNVNKTSLRAAYLNRYKTKKPDTEDIKTVPDHVIKFIGKIKILRKYAKDCIIKLFDGRVPCINASPALVDAGFCNYRLIKCHTRFIAALWTGNVSLHLYEINTI